MIFDEIWRADRVQKEENLRIRNTYHPKLEAAKKANDEIEFQSILSQMQLEYDLNDDADLLRSKRLEQQARALGIEVPPRPPADSAHDNVDWDFNHTTGTYCLSSKAELAITKALRKEILERLQFKMRLVSQVVIPLTGLIGTIMGLVSLLRAHK